MEGDNKGFGLNRPLGSGVVLGEACGLELRCDDINVRVVDGLLVEQAWAHVTRCEGLVAVEA
jgi:hypothetical protein